MPMRREYIGRYDRTPQQRLMAKTRVVGDCVFWTGYTNARGYGRIKVDGTLVGVHRLAYQLTKGPIPAGLEIDHLCKNPSCVRPEHLEAVTAIENWRRASSPHRLNALKTHCEHGHPFDELNTYWRPNGHRDCRTCLRERARRYLERKRQEARNAA